ncbi:DUF6232 family protein [Enterobacter ludwigii]|uniref:DUF6232 family protein n=1 Tax=Enterobacter ludwigii TaxID=299767 RepID=UPI003076353E
MEDVKEIEFYKQEADKKLQREFVQVTNARFVVGSNIYAMNGVTSVKKEKTPASRGYGFIIAMISGYAAYTYDSKWWKYGAAFMCFSAVVQVLTAKPTYIVTICSSSTETKALSSSDEKYIDKVIDALTQSIIKRG